MQSTNQWSWELLHLGSLLPSMGDWVWRRLWEQQENLFMPLGGTFLRRAAELFPTNPKSSWLMFYWTHRLPVRERAPDFSVDFRRTELRLQSSEPCWHLKLTLNCVYILDRFLYSGLDCLIFPQHPLPSSQAWFAICPILTVGFIQTTDLLHLPSPCHLLPGLAFFRGQMLTDSTHVRACCQEQALIGCFSPEFICFTGIISVNIMYATAGTWIANRKTS